MNQTDWGQPRPRHQYTYHPRPFPGQKGVLTYSGPLNMTAAAQGYGAYGTMGYGYGGYGYGGAYPAAYGGVCGKYGARTAYSSYPSYSYASSTPYYGHGGYYPTSHHYGGYGGYAHGPHMHYGRYANCFLPFQLSSYYRAGTVVPYGSYYGYPAAATTTYVAATTATPATAVATTSTTPKVQYAYVRAAATPTKLPDEYRTVNYTSRVVRTAEELQFENRRVATERGAYKARKIKPADAKADDVFWVRERNGDWNLRPYYQIEESCYPGLWQMDAEIGFLVFHRD